MEIHLVCFCDSNESVSHLLFQCSMAKAVWAIVAYCLGASNVPRSFDQCWTWCEKWLPFGEKIHAIGIAAICWAIWKTRNSVCFEGKVVTSPITTIYQAGLFFDGDKDELVAGANTMSKLVGETMTKKGNLPKDAKSDEHDK